MLYATVPLWTKTENKVWSSGMLISGLPEKLPASKDKTRGNVVAEFRYLLSVLIAWAEKSAQVKTCQHVAEFSGRVACVSCYGSGGVPE